MFETIEDPKGKTMTKYNVSGMSCAACSSRVERAVSGVAGVESCSVNLLTSSMTVEGDVSPEAVISAVVAAGYGASNIDGDLSQNKKDSSENREKSSETHAIILRLCLSCAFLAVLMYISMGHVMWNAPLPHFFENYPLATALAELLLSAAVLIINRRFFISGAKGLLHAAPNMDTLVSLGSGVSFLYSVYLVLLMCDQDKAQAHMSLHGLYFESAAMILTLITVGKLLEAYSKGKTTNALKALIKLSPKHALLLRDGKEITVPIEEVKRGDIFIVKAGESIATDGVVVEGSAAVDESSLTGESIPTEKEVGSQVYAASVNRNGYLVCEATEVGKDTLLSKIIQMVSDASATKAPIAKLADKVSGVFVPVVLAIAVLSAAVWLLSGESFGFALSRGISVLVISCPCALGLATPVAIMVGSGKGAVEGILFKNATALEEAGKTKIVAIDKTGTLTLGMPEVTDIIPYGETTKDTLISLAFSLERKSEHPLAHAIVSYAEQNNISAIECSDLRILAGNGLCAKIHDISVHGGSIKYIKSIIELPRETQEIFDRLAGEGKTPLFFSDESKLLGIIAVADKIKDDSFTAVSELHKMGISVVMLTGDNEKTAHAVADKIGIKRVIAGILPNEKEAAIRSLKNEGRVLMVGDGINDAPALTSADVGMAIGAGTEIAIDSADIVLVNSAPSDIAAAIRLSKKTLSNIRQNLFWAFFYNAIGIPLAAGAFIALLGWELDPMFGAAAMSLSSFCVVSNALRLNFVRLKSKKTPDQTNSPDARQQAIPESSNVADESTSITRTLYIEGMMCPHCEKAVKGALEAIDGVMSAVADHTLGTATVNLSTTVENDTLIKAVTAKGYTVSDCK